MILGLILTVVGYLILWWRRRSLSYPIILRPTIFQMRLIPVITVLLGTSFIAFGLYVISKMSLVLAIGITIIFGLYQAFRLSRNTVRARIDRVLQCYNEIRLANIVRLKRNQSIFDDTEIMRKTAALYARRQSWPRIKIDSFRLSFIDTDGAARITSIKDLAHALLLFEAREEHMDEWSDRHFAVNGENWKYLTERCERLSAAVSERNGAS